MPMLFVRAANWTRQQRLMRRLIRTHRRSLRSGRYVIVGELAYRTTYAPPRHLRDDKATSRFASSALLLGGVRGTGGYECLASGNGGVLLLGGDSGTVKRISREPLVDAGFLLVRERFSRYLPVPAVAMDPSGRVQVEQHVHGVCLRDLEEPQQLELVRGLLRRLASLCLDEQEGDSRRFIHEALGVLNLPVLPAAFSAWVPVMRSSSLAKAPLVPSHGDLWRKNILVDDSSAWTIDWDPRYAGLRPFWFDAMTLVGGSDPLRKAFIGGSFDSEFANLLAAVGMPPDVESVRHLLAMAHMATIAPFPRECRPGSRDHHSQVREHFNKWAAAVGETRFDQA